MRAKQKAAEAKKPKSLSDAIGSAFGEMFGVGNLDDNDIAIQVEDPDKKLVEVEFQDAGGKKLETQGRSSSTSNKVTTMVYNLRSKLPENAKLCHLCLRLRRPSRGAAGAERRAAAVAAVRGVRIFGKTLSRKIAAVGP